jgi:hypothetical protein
MARLGASARAASSFVAPLQEMQIEIIALASPSLMRSPFKSMFDAYLHVCILLCDRGDPTAMQPVIGADIMPKLKPAGERINLHFLKIWIDVSRLHAELRERRSLFAASPVRDE